SLANGQADVLERLDAITAAQQAAVHFVGLPELRDNEGGGRFALGSAAHRHGKNFRGHSLAGTDAPRAMGRRARHGFERNGGAAASILGELAARREPAPGGRASLGRHAAGYRDQRTSAPSADRGEAS